MLSSLFRPKRRDRVFAEEQPFFPQQDDTGEEEASRRKTNSQLRDDEEPPSDEDGEDLVEATPLLPIFSAAHLGRNICGLFFKTIAT